MTPEITKSNPSPIGVQTHEGGTEVMCVEGLQVTHGLTDTDAKDRQP